VSVTCAIWLTLVAMTVVGIGALSWRDIFVGWVDTPLVRIAGDLAIGAVAAVPGLLATTILAAILVSIVGIAPDPPIAIPPGGTGLLIGILAAAVVAPISEEIFYRGFATTAWARSFGPTGAIVRGGHLRHRPRPAVDLSQGTVSGASTSGRSPVAFALG
jgi:membrane protease YdiL (CAAX protease family)